MADPSIWQELTNEFQECGVICGDDLTAVYVDWPEPPPRERWSVTGGNVRLRTRFHWVPEKASLELGYKGADGQNFWLNLLRRDSPARATRRHHPEPAQTNSAARGRLHRGDPRTQ